MERKVDGYCGRILSEHGGRRVFTVQVVVRDKGA